MTSIIHDDEARTEGGGSLAVSKHGTTPGTIAHDGAIGDFANIVTLLHHNAQPSDSTRVPAPEGGESTTVIYSGDPLVGTAGDDYLIGARGPTGTAANTMVGADGDDLVIGDIDSIAVITSASTNTAFGAELDLEAMSSLWTTAYNPLVGNSFIPHATVFVEAAPANSWQYYKVHLDAGQTLTVDLDYGGYSPIGSGTAIETTLYRFLDGVSVLTDRGSSPGDGGAGSYAGPDGTSADGYLTYTASASGDFTVVVRRDLTFFPDGNFTGGESFVVNFSITGHSAAASAAPGNDTITGGTGEDALYGCGGDDTINGGDDNDIIDGGFGIDTLHGDNGNDTIRSGGDASAWGDDGNDLIYAGDTDVSEMLDGGTGVDTLDVSGFDFAAAYSINLATGMTTFAGESFLHFENLVSGASIDTITGTRGANHIRTGDGADTLNGAGGDDVLEGEADNDLINGQAGFDFASYEHAIAGVAVSLAISGIQNTLSAGNDTLTGIEGLIGSAFGDTLTGNAHDNVLIGGRGSNTLDGGGGIDAVSYADAASAVTVRLAGGTGQTGDGLTIDTLMRIENIVGTRYGDSLTGNGAANVISGGAGNDTLNGGGGSDTASYADAASGVTVDLSDTGRQATGGAGNDRLTSFEKLLGSRFGDTLTGNSGVNRLDGGDGNDWLDGGRGSDRLIGGAGHDHFTFSTKLENANIDTISGYDVADDTIQLSTRIFAGLALGKLAAGAFNTGSTAHGADDRILYDTATGALYFDRDGSGHAYDPIQFATVDPGLALTHSDFVVI